MLYEFLHIFLDRSRSLAHTENTIRGYQNRITFFMRWLEERKLTLADVRREHIVAFTSREMGAHGKPLSDETRNDDLRILKTFFNYLMEEGLLPQDPTVKVRYRRVPKKVKVLPSPEDLAKLLASFPDGKSPFITRRNQLLTLLLADTGLRISEALGLRLQDVDLRERCLHVTYEFGKGRKERFVPFSLSIAKQLILYIAKERSVWAQERGMSTDFLFIGEEGKLTPRAYQQALARACARSGVKVTPHGLRHMHGTVWVEQGGDLAALQVAMGHASITTTMKYVHQSFQSIREKNEEFSPLALMKPKYSPKARRKLR